MSILNATQSTVRTMGLPALIAVGAIACASRTCLAQAEGFIEKGDRVALLADGGSERARLAVDDLVAYLQKTLDVTVRRYPATADPAGLEESKVVVFGGFEKQPGLRALGGAPAERGRLGPESALVRGVAANGKTTLLLAGETVAGACHAVYSFLENELRIGFFIEGEHVPALARVRAAPVERVETPPAAMRGLLHHFPWKHPHANCWRLWSFDGWKKSIDWMRRKRMNTFVVFHDEGGYLWGDVIFRAFPEIPRNDFTLSQFVVDPTWRTELNKRILQYARESGLTIAYNFFYSQVPEFFARYHPQLEYHELNMRNVGISARQPECRQIMQRYWKAILDTYGVDDSHVYMVCPYQHERNLPDYFNDHVAPTQQAVDVLKALDPRAKIYVESWCWKYRHEKQSERTNPLLTSNVAANWKAFNDNLPRDVGVVEWDLWRSHRQGLPADFGGRPFVQLTHTNMEGWWPPATTRNHPQFVLDLFNSAYDRGAQGVLFFHIQAGHTEILADLASKIGWDRRVELPAFYRDYARRRFGDKAAGPMAESLALYCDAADLGATSETSDYSTSLTFPGFTGSAEQKLKILTLQGAERKKWLTDRLQLFEPKARLAADALLAARAVAPALANDEMYQKHVWELDYLAARFDGIRSLYRAHLLAETDPALAAALWQRALVAFEQVRALFRDRPDYRMADLRKLEPDVPYTSAFLNDWETRGFWQPRVKSFQVVWERLDEFEALVNSLKPEPIAK